MWHLEMGFYYLMHMQDFSTCARAQTPTIISNTTKRTNNMYINQASQHRFVNKDAGRVCQVEDEG